MAARVYYYAEDLTETTNNSTTPATKVSITFPQVSGKSYAIFWQSNFTSQTATREGFFRLQDVTNGITYQEFRLLTEDASDNIVLSDVYAYTADTTGDITFEVQFFRGGSNTTITAAGTTISVLELSDNDVFSYTAGETTTTSNVFSTLNSVTVGAGDWFIIAAMGVSWSSTAIAAGNAGMRIFDGTTAYMLRDSLSVNATTDYSPYWAVADVSPATTTTYNLQHQENTTQTLSSRYRTILALRKSDFEETFSAVDETTSTTTSNTNQVKLTLTQTPTYATNYLILGFWSVKLNNATGFVKSSMTENSVSYFIVEPSREPQDIDEDFQNGLVRQELLSTTSYTWEILYRSNTSGQTSSIENSAIVVLNLGGMGAMGYSFGYIIY